MFCVSVQSLCLLASPFLHLPYEDSVYDHSDLNTS
jgi:hypothetical protein